MVAHVQIDPGFDVGLIKRENKELAKKLGDWRSVWRNLMPDLSKSALEAIRTQGSSIKADKWPPLKTTSLRSRLRRGKRRKARSRAPLVGTGKMQKRIMKKTGYRRRLTRKMLVFGPKTESDLIVSGGSRGGSVPARNFIGWSRSSQFALDKISSERINDILEAYSFGG